MAATQQHKYQVMQKHTDFGSSYNCSYISQCEIWSDPYRETGLRIGGGGAISKYNRLEYFWRQSGALFLKGGSEFC